MFCWDCGQRGVLTRDCCRRNRAQARSMSIFDSEVGSETPVATFEKSNLVADIILAGFPLKGLIDTGANRSIVKARMPNFLPHILDTTMVVTKIRMADGTLHQSVADNVTLGLDFLKERGHSLSLVGITIRFRKKTKQLPFGKIDATTCRHSNSSQTADKAGTYGPKPQRSRRNGDAHNTQRENWCNISLVSKRTLLEEPLTLPKQNNLKSPRQNSEDDEKHTVYRNPIRPERNAIDVAQHMRQFPAVDTRNTTSVATPQASPRLSKDLICCGGIIPPPLPPAATNGSVARPTRHYQWNLNCISNYCQHSLLFSPASTI
uniref:Peptidase A2 domain-containing protein n=1 Tax=Glossina austeni TaxID=7395 RepID=A0A1A9VMT2_GLOAU